MIYIHILQYDISIYIYIYHYPILVFVSTPPFADGLILNSTSILWVLKVKVRVNTSSCPRLSAAIFVCAENVVNMGVFCIMANFMLYIGMHSIGTCASLLHIVVVVIVIVIEDLQ